MHAEHEFTWQERYQNTDVIKKPFPEIWETNLVYSYFSPIRYNTVRYRTVRPASQPVGPPAGRPASSQPDPICLFRLLCPHKLDF